MIQFDINPILILGILCDDNTNFCGLIIVGLLMEGLPMKGYGYLGYLFIVFIVYIHTDDSLLVASGSNDECLCHPQF